MFACECLREYMCVSACVSACACASVHVCVCVCVCACVCLRVCVRDVSECMRSFNFWGALARAVHESVCVPFFFCALSIAVVCSV